MREQFFKYTFNCIFSMFSVGKNHTFEKEIPLWREWFQLTDSSETKNQTDFLIIMSTRYLRCQN